jgi:Kef-type K+ transport system membrane component KefB
VFFYLMNKLKKIVILTVESFFLAAVLYWIRGKLELHDDHQINTILPILIDVAFLAILATFGAKLGRVIGIGGMAGKIVFGILAGPAFLNMLQPDATGVEIARLAGVLFILFEAGLHFDLNRLIQHISISMKTAFLGVLGSVGLFVFFGYFTLDLPLVAALFLGGVFTSTSVGLTVAALREAKEVNTPLGIKVIGAAIIDDIIAIIMLTALVKYSEGGLNAQGLLSLGGIVTMFMLATYILWHFDIGDKIARYLDRSYDHVIEQTYTRFFFGALIAGAAIASVIGLDPVLGAFGTGVVLSKVDDEIKRDAWEKIEGYMHIFVGGFLVSIGTLLTRESLFSLDVWALAIFFTALAFLGKSIVRILYKDKCEGKVISYAMSIRGEIGLVFVTVGLSSGVLSSNIASAGLLAVILVTMLGSILFDKEVRRYRKLHHKM